MTLYAFLAGLLAITVIGLVVAIPMILVLIVSDIVLTLVGAYRASQGEAYRYPCTIRLL